MRRTLGFLLVLIAVSGCGQTSFIGTRVDNFTAYYNKFFNAKKAFERGLKSLEQRDTRVDRNLYLPLFTNPDAAAASSDFQDTIKKCADVLREHPDSKWVDDALLLIGKSYFYQRNYVGAEQKFLEVVGLGTALEDEARFWLARTLITGGNFDEAAVYLTESLGRENVSRRWKPKMQLALGELYVQRGDWENAAETLASGLEAVRDNDLGARAQFLLGQIYETTGDHERALAAYERVDRFHPLYELSYAAKISAVRVQGSYLDDEAALRELRRLERDDKHYQYRNELAYVRGLIYQMQGHPDDAFLVYDDILYEADGDVASVRGRIHYALGELYRDSYQDFLTAAAHFDTAATQIGTRSGAAGSAQLGAAGTGPGATRYAPEAIIDAVELKEMFASFSDVMYRINEMDSVLYLGSLEQAAFDEAILGIRRQLAEELAAQQRELERRQASQAFQDAGAAESMRARGATNAVSGAGSEAGFLYHLDPMLAEEARINFQNIWGERPLVPDWRRRDAVNQYLATVSETGVEGDSVVADILVAGDQLPHVDISGIPRDSLSRAEMRARRAAASYELGNVLFLSMNRPDSAAAWYRTVIEDADDSTLIQRAYYALAEVQQSLGDENAARQLYEEVFDISASTELGRQIGQRLGIAAPGLAEGDTLAAAKAAYERAYFHWQRGSYHSALSEMIHVAGTYPDTEVAPRALMAAGIIYSEWAQKDSLDLLGSIPVSVPDSLLNAIGLSVRTTRVVPDTAAIAVAPDSIAGPGAADSLSAMQSIQESLASEDASSIGDAASPGARSVRDSTLAPTSAYDSTLAASPDVPHAPDSILASSRTTAAAADSLLAAARGAMTESDSALADQSDALALPDKVADTPAAADSAGEATGVVRPRDSAPARMAEILARRDSVQAEVPLPVDSPSADAPLAIESPPADAARVADSVRGNEMAAAVDSIIVEEVAPINLERLYASIATRYADSPFGKRASNIREVLTETRRERARADSIALAVADSARAAEAGSVLQRVGAPTHSPADSTLAGAATSDSSAAGVSGVVGESFDASVADTALGQSAAGATGIQAADTTRARGAAASLSGADTSLAPDAESASTPAAGMPGADTSKTTSTAGPANAPGADTTSLPAAIAAPGDTSGADTMQTPDAAVSDTLEPAPSVVPSDPLGATAERGDSLEVGKVERPAVPEGVLPARELAPKRSIPARAPAGGVADPDSTAEPVF